ncbi:MAG: hypothetical protein NTW86_00420 [Candidatus Sumerlaeota bacterium]|nr:hypothetical protein [Candidatus Sumerlaeota bacterium]
MKTQPEASMSTASQEQCSLTASRQVTRAYRALVFLPLLWLVCVSPLLARDDSPSLTSQTLEATLHISTSKPALLNKDIHSAGTMDIFIQRGFEPTDILGESYLSKVRALNLQSLNYPGGPGHSDNYHLIVGDTQIKGGKGDGENFDLNAGRNAKGVQQGFATPRYGVDFFNELCAFTQKLGIPCDLIVNMETGTLEEILWGLERLHSKRVIFGMEECNQLLKEGGLGSEKVYVEKVMSWLSEVRKKFPHIISVLDPAPVWRVSSPRGGLQTHIDWNRALQTIPADEVRGYFWDRDVFRFTASKNSIGRLDEAFDKVLPDWLRQFQEAFPGKRFSVYQWGQKATSPEFNTVFGCLFFARMYQWVITYNREYDDYIAFMGLETLRSLGLASGRVVTHYHVLALIGQLFVGAPKVLEASVQGAKGVFVACCEQEGRYTLLMINENGEEVKAPRVTIDGSLVNPTFHEDILYGKSLESREILQEKSDTKTLALKPYSVNVIRF